MSEMIERVARAIYAAADAQDYVSAYKCHSTCLDGKFDLEMLARAAIEAMRFPTDAMMDASHNMYPGNFDTVGAEWREMIDAALKSPSGV